MSYATKLELLLDNGTDYYPKVSRGLSLTDDKYLKLGASTDAYIGWNTTQTVDALFLGTATGQNTLLVAEVGDVAYDFNHGAQTNPTIFLHSAAQSGTQYLSLAHDQTDGVITTGAGSLTLDIAGDTIQTAANKDNLLFNIPVTGTDNTLHTIDLRIDGDSGISIAATGDGSAHVGVKTISIGTTAEANVIHIGGGSALVDITDAHWSVSEAGAASFVGVGAGGALTGVTTLALSQGITQTTTVTGTLYDMVLETEWTGGTLINADFGGSTTQATDMLGIVLDFNTNLAGVSDKDVTGISLKTPALTQGVANTTTYIGYNLATAGACVQSAGAGTITWKGINLAMPNTTQTAGTVTATGLSITGGTQTSGTQRGIDITMAAAANTAIYVGTGTVDFNGNAVNNVGAAGNDFGASNNLVATTMSGAIAMGTNKITGLGDPTDAQDGATKHYVDTAIASGEFTYFLTDTASDLGAGYYRCQTTDTAQAESTFLNDALAAGQTDVQLTIGTVVTGFVTPTAEPSFHVLRAGLYAGHFHLQKTAGTSTATFKWKLFEKANVGGAETLIMTSEQSSAITAKDGFDIHATLAADYNLTAGDRLVLRLYFTTGGTGSGATISLFAEGTVDSHFSITQDANDLEDVFVTRDGTKGMNADLTPTTTDTAALGTTALQWSDLYLAEGGAINWDNADVTLIQTGNELALAGGDFALGANSITGIGSSITGTKNTALTISVPTQGTDDANGVGMIIAADAAGSGGTGNHNGGILTLRGGAKQGSGADGYVRITDGTDTPGNTLDDESLFVKGILEVDGMVYADGGVTGALTGNASTATTLQTARSIGGTSFNGSADITVATATGGFTVSGGVLSLTTQMIAGAQGTDIASATDATLTATGNYFDVTGATTTTTLTAPTGIQAGTIIILQFDGAPLIKHATAGTGKPFQLSGAADFQASAGDTLGLIYDGTNYRELFRTAI